MRPGAWALLGAVAFIVAAYIVWPLLTVGGQSITASDGGWTFGHYTGVARAEWDRSALWGSVWISLATVALSALVGVPLAVLFSGPEFPGRRLFGALIILPMALPPLVGVLAFQRLFTIDPLIKHWFGMEPIDGIPMVLIVHVYSFFVYFYLFTRTGLESLDPSLAEAARNLGASRRKTMLAVMLPSIWPHLLAGAMVTFMVSMASFTAPYVFASKNLRVLSVEIQRSWKDGRGGRAAVQSMLLATVCIVFLLLVRRLERRRSHGTGKGVARRPEPYSSRWLPRSLSALSGVIVLFAALPHLTIAGLSFVTKMGVDSSLTLQHYREVLGNPEVFRPITNSLRLALLASLGTAAFGLGAGYLLGRLRYRGQAILDVGVMLPFALPGTVIAFCLITAFNESSWLVGGQELVGTSGILALAYFVRHVPLAVRPTVAAFRTLDPSLEEAAGGLGASWSQTMTKVLLPCVLPGLLAGVLLGFVASLGEFVSSIMLKTMRSKPISVAIWQKMDQFQVEQAAVYSVLLMFLVAASLAVYSVLTRRTSTAASMV